MIESGSWAIASGKQVLEHLGGMKNMEIAQPVITVLSSIQPEQCAQLDALCRALVGNEAQ
ncbi:MAG: hypothetical protein IH607_06000 [Firmicutes bacterium]|nr:hypothetical protein [Bacillota bacterium]